MRRTLFFLVLALSVCLGATGVAGANTDQRLAQVASRAPAFGGMFERNGVLHVYLTNSGTGSLNIIDINDPSKPTEVARWWFPGQWTAGGEKPGENWVDPDRGLREGLWAGEECA